MLGRKLYQRFLEQSETQAFDVDLIAPELGLTPGQVFNQARVPVQLGYARSRQATRMWTPSMPPPPPLTPTQFLGRFQLAEEGYRWAAMGYPEESAGRATNTTVNVDIHMAVTSVIEQAQESEADQDLKDRFELLMRKVEAELQKPEGLGSMQPVKDVLEVANNAKGLMGPAVKFMDDHWDKIQTFGGMSF